jgi:hypothetical protein
MLSSHITDKINSVGQITILDNVIEGNHGRYSHHRGLWPSSVQIHPPAPWDEQAVLPTLCWQAVPTDSGAAPDFRLQNTCFTQRPYYHLGRTAKLIRSFAVRQFGAHHLGRKGETDCARTYCYRKTDAVCHLQAGNNSDCCSRGWPQARRPLCRQVSKNAPSRHKKGLCENSTRPNAAAFSGSIILLFFLLFPLS